MPRARKNNHGGARAGKPGRAYKNRSDLNRPKLMAVPDQTYGKQAEQLRSQQAVPMGSPPDAFSGAMEAAAAFPGAEDLDGLMGKPTEFPDEPLTSGMPFGAGAGPEVLGLGGTMFNPSPAAALLSYLASLPIAPPEVKELAYTVGQQSEQELLPEPAGLSIPTPPPMDEPPMDEMMGMPPGMEPSMELPMDEPEPSMEPPMEQAVVPR